MPGHHLDGIGICGVGIGTLVFIPALLNFVREPRQEGLYARPEKATAGEGFWFGVNEGLRLSFQPEEVGTMFVRLRPTRYLAIETERLNDLGENNVNGGLLGLVMNRS